MFGQFEFDDIKENAMIATTTKPFEFQREHDGSLSVEAAVFQALGAASTCWEHMEGTGEFASTRAREIGDKLMDFVDDDFESRHRDYEDLQAKAVDVEWARDLIHRLTAAGVNVRIVE